MDRRSFIFALPGAALAAKLLPPAPKVWAWETISTSAIAAVDPNDPLLLLLRKKIEEAERGMTETFTRSLFHRPRFDAAGFETRDWTPDPYWRDAERRYHV